MRNRRFFIFSAIVLLLAGAAFWWRQGQRTQVGAAAVERGTAVEIVYATGGVEPVRWARVASLIARPHRRDLRLRGQGRRQGRRAGAARRPRSAGADEGTEGPRGLPSARWRAVSDLIDARHRHHAGLSSAPRRTCSRWRGLIAVQIEKISDYTILAPMDGVVLRRDGEIGEIAEAGQILFRVGVPQPLQVVAEVNEEDIPRVALAADRAVPH